MRRILRAVNVGRVNSVRLGDALHSLTLTEISLLPLGARSVSFMLQAIGALLSLLSASSGLGSIYLTRSKRMLIPTLGRKPSFMVSYHC